MRDFPGVLVVLADGTRRIFLPGPEDPEISSYMAQLDASGNWLEIYAVARREGGYLACRFSARAVLSQEPIP